MTPFQGVDSDSNSLGGTSQIFNKSALMKGAFSYPAYPHTPSKSIINDIISLTQAIVLLLNNCHSEQDEESFTISEVLLLTSYSFPNYTQ